MTKHSRLVVLALSVLPLLASCDSGGPALTPHFKFSYSGLASGTVDLTGTKTDGNEQGVLGFVESGAAVVLGVDFRNSPPVGYVALAFTASTSGTIPFSADCEVGSGCTGLTFLLMAANQTTPVLCSMTSGSLTVATSNNTRSNGTFSGTATCTNPEDETVVGTLTLSDGSFAAQYGANPLGSGK